MFSLGRIQGTFGEIQDTVRLRARIQRQTFSLRGLDRLRAARRELEVHVRHQEGILRTKKEDEGLSYNVHVRARFRFVADAESSSWEIVAALVEAAARRGAIVSLPRTMNSTSTQIRRTCAL